MTPAAPARGDVWMVDISGGQGSEQRGRRPVLIIQNDVGNRFAKTTIVAAISTTIKTLPIMVALKRGDAGLREASAVNLSQLFTVDKARLERRLGGLSPESLARVDAAIRISLDVG